MTTQTGPFIVKDRRRAGFFITDNSFLDLYGPIVGPFGIAVYSVLCRRAGNKETCYPSQKGIGALCGMSEKQVYREIKNLILLGIISSTEKAQLATGRWSSLIYTLLPQEKWKIPPVLAKKRRKDFKGPTDSQSEGTWSQPTDSQSDASQANPRTESPIKKETNKYKKEDTGAQGKLGVLLPRGDRFLTAMLPIGSRLDRFISRRPRSGAERDEKTSQFRAVDELVKRRGGEERAMEFVQSVIAGQKDKYFPRVTSPKMLMNRYDEIVACLKLKSSAVVSVQSPAFKAKEFTPAHKSF